MEAQSVRSQAVSSGPSTVATGVTYDFSKVPAKDLENVKLVVNAFTNWHDASRVSNEDVKSARKALAAMSYRTVPGKNMLYFRLDEITSFHPHAGGPGVIAPDGSVRGKIMTPGSSKPIEVTFNLLADPIVLDLYRDPAEKPKTPIEKLQELAATNPEFAAMVASPEAVFATFNKAVTENDTIAAAMLFVPGSLGKLIQQPDRDNLNVLLITGLEPFKGFVLGEKLSEREEGGVTRHVYATRKGGETGTQEFERHGAIWLIVP